MTQSKHYFLFAGEKSGDLHGGHLIEAIKQDFPTSLIRGVGGPNMRAAGIDSVLKMEQFQVMGFSDVLKSLPKLWRQFYLIRDEIVKTQPDCVILIDYPGFNLRLAKALRQQGFKGKIVQYICPTVWAHGKKRIHHMANTLDLLLTIYPFENACFAETPLNTCYIGNPLVDNILTYQYKEQWHQEVGLSRTDPLLAIFPGSRIGEIEQNFPQQLKAAFELKKEVKSLQIAVSCAHESLKLPLEKIIRQMDSEKAHLIPSHLRYELMRDCKTAIAKSGTVTLELALHEKPTIVTYQLTWLNAWVAHYILRLNLPHYCIVNILGQNRIYPELISQNVTSEHILQSLRYIHCNHEIRLRIIAACQQVRSMLGHKKTHQLAAKAIQDILSC